VIPFKKIRGAREGRNDRICQSAQDRTPRFVCVATGRSPDS